MSTLYIVPTPIGNLEDITLRALRILHEAVLIAAEDTRTTRILLDHYEIKTPLISYHEHNKLIRLKDIFDALAHGDVALVSDAGTPGVSDPGYELIQAAISLDVKVVPLPGANAAVTALVASGLPTDSYVYLGFPPRKTTALRQFIEDLAEEPRTMIFYESPHRLNKTLAVMHEMFGDRPAVAARELTKLHEEIIRGRLEDLIRRFLETPPRGEITLLVGGFVQEEEQPMWDEARVRAVLASRLALGEKRSAAVKAIAQESGWDRRALYDLEL
jgi:16S rRNA (cytidine1402-2'-O)-methyltransferase